MGDPHFQDIQQMLAACPPWFVRRYWYRTQDASELEISLAHDAGAHFRCALCDRTLPCHGDGPEWIYRCLTCVGTQVVVRFRIPQLDCPLHGLVHADVHWMRHPEHWLLVRVAYEDEELVAGAIH